MKRLGRWSVVFWSAFAGWLLGAVATFCLYLLVVSEIGGDDMNGVYFSLWILFFVPQTAAANALGLKWDWSDGSSGREMFQLVLIACFNGSLLACPASLCGILVRTLRQERVFSIAEPLASPNGGPVAASHTSPGTGGPPSVS